MVGIELVTDTQTKTPAVGLGGRVVAEARKRGLLLRVRGGQIGDYPIGDTLCVAPPLVITEAQVDRVVEILQDSIRAAAS
jgi:4-aminobutyrate aminotransferase-like enzyme